LIYLQTKTEIASVIRKLVITRANYQLNDRKIRF